ncbi:MAG TPA: GNAT family N-acetyltransferase [Gaiellaceae bacterium]|nr:GNAT family N-acetyltransferase [Gaiellaceae bacterium]
MTVRDLRPGDWSEVAHIYAQGIATGNATFETAVPSWEDWDDSHLRELRLVAEEDGQVVGWIALSPVSSRPCYAGVAEISVYVAESARGRGVGSGLLDALVDSAERDGIWTLQTSVFPENGASLALLRRFGFRVVGTRERIGRLHGIWRDTVLVERRSEVVR